MDFLTQKDLLSLIDEVTLSDVIDDDNSLLTATEGNAMEEMKGYLSTRFDVAKVFDPGAKNGLVVMYLTDMVLYHLHSRVAPDNIPEIREERYKRAINWLEKVADGFISPNLPIKAPEEKSTLRYGGSLPKQNHYY